MAAGGSTGRLLVGAWAGIVMLMAGQVVDLRWHAANGGFETASDQVGAHWLIWLGCWTCRSSAPGGFRHGGTWATACCSRPSATCWRYPAGEPA
jgi:hypothetical protein